jgi:hypothetical protein
MKKPLYLLLIALLICNISWAQVPESFNYQAVIRDNSGELITDQSIDVKIYIINNSADGTVLYTEAHNETTNSYGQVNLIIGEGTVETGIFSQINWGESNKFLNIEVDAGSGLADMGTFQLFSVPYALYANSAGKADALGSEGVYSTASDTLFVVKDHDGNVVFVVFPDGAQVIVNETVKGSVGGFAVSGRSPSKAVDIDILKVTVDSTRIYVNDTVTAKGLQ